MTSRPRCRTPRRQQAAADAKLGTEPSGVASELQQRFGGTGEQQTEDQLAIGHGDTMQFTGQSEDDMEAVLGQVESLQLDLPVAGPWVSVERLFPPADDHAVGTDQPKASVSVTPDGVETAFGRFLAL